VYEELARIAEDECGDLVSGSRLLYHRASVPLKLRLLIRDGTFVDVWPSPDGKRYAYHWEQRAVRGMIHRHGNAPDHPGLDTFPKHFHNGSEEAVLPSTISDDFRAALREFLTFVRGRLQASA
jgi:hypothetical protein